MISVDDRTPPSAMSQIMQRILCQSYIKTLIVYSFSAFLVTYFYCKDFTSLNVFLPKKWVSSVV